MANDIQPLGSGETCFRARTSKVSKKVLHGFLGKEKHILSCLNWVGNVEQKPHFNTSNEQTFVRKKLLPFLDATRQAPVELFV